MWNCLLCGRLATRATRDTEEPLCESHGGYDGDGADDFEFELWNEVDDLDFEDLEDEYFALQDDVNYAEAEED